LQRRATRRRYEENTQNALKRGIKDAIAGAAAVALNNYLDLGAGVLILWSGLLSPVPVGGAETPHAHTPNRKLYSGNVQSKGSLHGLAELTAECTDR
jgi:hypothetical protein